MNFLDSETLSKLINIIIASTKIKEIKLPHMYLRPSFHTIICGNIGSGKSHLLKQVCEHLKILPITSLTPATFLGTVDKDMKELIPPAIWDYRNTILPIDEYSFDAKKTSDKTNLNILLGLLENPLYRKKMGFRCMNKKYRDKDLYCKVKNNTVEVKTRFSLMMTTMMQLNRLQNQQIIALISRCLIIPFNLSMDELKSQAKGRIYYHHKNIKTEDKIIINRLNYDKIIKLVDDNRIQKTSYLRTIGELCRVYAVLGKYNEEMFNLIINLKKNVW